MAAFPSTSEREAASALLLLSVSESNTPGASYLAPFPSTSEREAASALLQLSRSESNTPDPPIRVPDSLRHRANAVLKFLSGRCYSEAKIRQVLGDTPDTSKALRFLLGNGEVKRSGKGGRQDPFIYTKE